MTPHELQIIDLNVLISWQPDGQLITVLLEKIPVMLPAHWQISYKNWYLLSHCVTPYVNRASIIEGMNSFKMTITLGVNINWIYYTIYSKLLCLILKIPPPIRQPYANTFWKRCNVNHYKIFEPIKKSRTRRTSRLFVTRLRPFHFNANSFLDMTPSIRGNKSTNEEVKYESCLKRF